MYPILNIFGLEVRSTQFFVILCIVVSFGFYVLRAKKYNLTKGKAMLMCLAYNIGGFAGGKILYIIKNHISMEAGVGFWGFAYYGAVLIIPIFVLATLNLFEVKADQVFDFGGPSMLMQLAIYRVGCLLNGCCYGIEASWGMAMAHSPEVLRVPVQLIEIILDVAIFVAMLAYEKKGKYKGILYPIFMVAYGVIRFVLECFRVRTILFAGMSIDHILSLVSIAIGIIWIYFKHFIK